MNQLYYCTVSETRGLSAEMPIGDPVGFGKKQMPIAVVAMAAGSFAAGAAAFTAAASLTSMVVAGAMMVGSALTIVGVATGNENLTKIGGIISLVGGAAGIATGAFGAASGAAGEGMAAGETGANMGVGGSGMDGVVSGSAAPVSELPGTLPSDAMMSPTSDAASTAAGNAGASPSGIINSNIDAATATPAANAAANPYQTGGQNALVTPELSKTSAFTTEDAANLAEGGAGVGQPVTPGGPVTIVNPSGASPTGLINSGGDTLGGYFDKFGNFVKNNKELTNVGVNVLGGLIPSNKTQAETDLSRAQAERIRSMTAQEKERQLWRRGLINS